MIEEQIDQDLKAALKEKNEIVVSSLRNLKAALKNSEIEKKKELSDEEATSIIAKKVKQHKDSIEGFKAGNRNDLVEHEQAQMAVLQKYLPAGMSEEEVATIVKQVIADSNATVKDFGKVMKEVMTRVKDAADGNVISKLVKENLK
ncbi:MAG: glutamyl-tRNA amidotransferase [Candidatus Doudnabacteria bacterium RIFCSPLOWO2_02_FULL_42_9]|uniref:Glutamyl-tRNA amidotransferase n=1 Tax=Candidatus Doudnabacteria bacterium RIFCSPHIGHO2_01_FULL_41_86 TaxID=1817821 RepID=A0A1F5N9T2_9BACT|nr:MAG: glutamyl-tRNA amidotransferase [Candidatus Doudnabacteria bacterium RIFCSPHIGHO2_01_FULL_41_86]OGE75477.1 MAG: glutamyl-tRNA amidotransferase [Candidatus Doudnabacteria bacterium RIFCSPHIGHO2_01_43_10]OGE85434.1 MAG: glutamyl-tRNA amidotransferase [Candidatus Doudnabacteria bacterium RIFCSPHIGHO2_12_FULL_42_22]OGE86972.1 MAG: glutamyl-tRNA amidotransferase [Candidatus Doudnabacteria bacterium RIFCSPHIGHO2_02_FULL_42_25]OGE92571.1 MAG: glutamyl-tRNA amidotransferase [Candidatus Doudnabac